MFDQFVAERRYFDPTQPGQPEQWVRVFKPEPVPGGFRCRWEVGRDDFPSAVTRTEFSSGADSFAALRNAIEAISREIPIESVSDLRD